MLGLVWTSLKGVVRQVSCSVEFYVSMVTRSPSCHSRQTENTRASFLRENDTITRLYNARRVRSPIATRSDLKLNKVSQ